MIPRKMDSSVTAMRQASIAIKKIIDPTVEEDKALHAMETVRRVGNKQMSTSFPLIPFVNPTWCHQCNSERKTKAATMRPVSTITILIGPEVTLDRRK
jgi:hypothetical protein